MLIDSNVIIYAAQPENKLLRDFIATNAPPVSAVSYVEVLGYDRHTDEERQYYADFFEAATILPISSVVSTQITYEKAAEQIIRA